MQNQLIYKLRNLTNHKNYIIKYITIHVGLNKGNLLIFFTGAKPAGNQKVQKMWVNITIKHQFVN